MASLAATTTAEILGCDRHADHPCREILSAGHMATHGPLMANDHRCNRPAEDVVVRPSAHNLDLG